MGLSFSTESKHHSDRGTVPEEQGPWRNCTADKHTMLLYYPRLNLGTVDAVWIQHILTCKILWSKLSSAFFVLPGSSCLLARLSACRPVAAPGMIFTSTPSSYAFSSSASSSASKSSTSWLCKLSAAAWATRACPCLLNHKQTADKDTIFICQADPYDDITMDCLRRM